MDSSVKRKNSNLSLLGHLGLEKLVALGIKKVAPQKVVLFGSRAKKTHRESSDFDIAFFFPETQSEAWTQFLFEIADSSLVLFRVDWVDANHAAPELRAQIAREGVVLYEEK